MFSPLHAFFVILLFASCYSTPSLSSCALLSLYVVPSAPPTSLTVSTLTSRTLNVTWNFPILEEQNGDIISYTILLEDRDDVNGYTVVQEEDTEELGIVLEELLPFHLYYVSVAASTQVGLGPYTARVLVEMSEDGKRGLVSFWY